MSDKELRNIGYQIAMGVFRAMGFICIFVILINLILNVLDAGIDDSDQDGWNRSGLKIHKDAKTGKEYISTPNGGLLPR